MTSRERMNRAMRPRAGRLPDRVPVMCQLSLGHYFLHAGPSAVEVWHDTAVFGDALLALRERYGFDGILVNLPGRDPRWRDQISTVERHGRDTVVRWVNGAVTTAPPDDNPHVRAAGRAHEVMAERQLAHDRYAVGQPPGARPHRPVHPFPRSHAGQA